MPKVFLWAAASEVFLLVAAAALGLVGGEDARIQRYHVALALFSSVLACFLHAVAFTYFAVTGKLVHQAVALGRLDPAPATVIRAFKRKATSLVGVGVVSIAVAVGTGAWRLSGTEGPRWHLLAAALAFAFNAAALYREHDLITRAALTLEDVMREYRARGRSRPDSTSPIPEPR